MKFHWVASIALWTILSGPAMYGSGPAPAAKKTATSVQIVKVESDTTPIKFVRVELTPTPHHR